MKMLLIADLEGASGIVSNNQQSKPGAPLYEEARSYLLSDVNAAVEGALEGGAEEVIIFDMHYFGLNMNLHEIHPKTKTIMGKPRKISPFFTELYREISGIIMIGFHASSQTPNGLLTHSYDYAMKSIKLNGVLMGEIGMEAAIAGFYNVPLIFVAGDSVGINEAKNLLNEVETAVVKYSINEHSALCLPLEVTKREIKEKSRRSVQNINKFSPFVIDSPYIIEVEFFDKIGVQKAEGFPGLRKIKELAIRIEGDNLPLLWENFIGFYQNYD